MATVSPKLTLPFILGTGATSLLGQGNQPEAWILYTTDDASNPSPVWNDATAKIRNFSTSRGRESELAEFDAGSATLTLDNRTRTFDPNSNAAIRPFNRWWIREQFTGETRDIFKGYAESYDNQWPQGFDAECVVTCADEFKVLSLDRLPVTNPPRDTYADVVLFDKPNNYWRIEDETGTQTLRDELGAMDLTGFGVGNTRGTGGAIVGDPDDRYMTVTGTLFQPTDAPFQGQGGDAAGQSVLTIEAWISVFDLPGTNTIIAGPLPAAGGRQYVVAINTDGSVSFSVHTSTSTYTATSNTGAIVPNTFYHLVGVFGSNLASLYINGGLVASVATAGTIITGYTGAVSTSAMFLNNSATSTSFDEVAFYRYALSTGRVLAHYQAGAQRGFPQQSSDARFRAVLDASTSNGIPCSWTTGVRTVQPRYMNGQPPLDKIREAVAAEAVDAAFFVKADGSLTFLASDHRSSSPYNTVQATFGDAAGEILYLDVNVDYSESFLANEWTVTRDGGETATATDATSIARYFKRSQSLTGLALVSDADSSTVAAAMLAKYKDPMQRVTGISFSTVDTSVSEAVFRRELMDKITVKRTPPGGGSRISQDLFIQKIEVSGANDGTPWSVRWAVSPV